jgi:hypothetical protein
MNVTTDEFHARKLRKLLESRLHRKLTRAQVLKSLRLSNERDLDDARVWANKHHPEWLINVDRHGLYHICDEPGDLIDRLFHAAAGVDGIAGNHILFARAYVDRWGPVPAELDEDFQAARAFHLMAQQSYTFLKTQLRDYVQRRDEEAQAS